jgi:hypothetical protein
MLVGVGERGVFESEEKMRGQEKEEKHRRKDRGPRLTERDLFVLTWIGEQYALRVDQLRVILAAKSQAEISILSESAMRHHVTRWEQLGLVEYRKFLAREPGWVWLTPAGLRAVNLEFSVYRPYAGVLEHLYWCNQARLFLVVKRPGVWRSERYLRTEGKEQRSAIVNVPDGQYVWNGGVIAIEVELSAKREQRLVAHLRSLTGTYQAVWYFITDEVRGVLTRALGRLEPGARSKIQIYDRSRLVG